MTEDKKEYIKPEMTVVEMEVETPLLSHSGWENHGDHGHACEHNKHWFCEDTGED